MLPSLTTAVPRAGAFALSLAVAGCSVFGAPAAEEPRFTVVETDGAIEIRDYPTIAIVKTTVAAESRDAAVGEGFGRLFDYITGANRGAREIAMTAPVFVEGDAGTEIAMTAPVLVEEETATGARAWTTVFVLPDAMTRDTAPVPTQSNVALDSIDGRRVAAIRFSGFFSESNIEAAEDELRTWLGARGIAHQGDWVSAGYNPPWTLPWLRRNEVIVTLR